MLKRLTWFLCLVPTCLLAQDQAGQSWVVTTDVHGNPRNQKLVLKLDEGTTMYLQVTQPGALLFVGDGHAAQGDGELTGDALETSMDVEFPVDLIPDKPILTPRVESSTHIVALGLAGSIGDAFRSATAGLTQWLEQDYSLTAQETALVLGTSVEYIVHEVADRNAGVAAQINKARLAGLTRAQPRNQ